MAGGPASVFCASQQQAKVTGLDIDDSVFPLSGYAGGGQRLQGKTPACRLRRPEGDKQLAKFDTLIGADICFWDGLTDELLTLFKRARKAGVKQVLLADPGRTTFVKLRDECEQRWPGEHPP